MAHARVDPLTRDIIIRVGRVVPPRDMRAALYTILDDALDMLDAPQTETTIVGEKDG